MKERVRGWFGIHAESKLASSYKGTRIFDTDLCSGEVQNLVALIPSTTDDTEPERMCPHTPLPQNLLTFFQIMADQPM